MQARYPGRCVDGDAIEVGDEITKSGRGWKHRWHNAPGAHPWLKGDFVDMDNAETYARSLEDEGNAAERRMLDQEYAAGVEDANRERFNRQMFGESYAAAEEYARDLRGLNGDW